MSPCTMIILIPSLQIDSIKIIRIKGRQNIILRFTKVQRGRFIVVRRTLKRNQTTKAGAVRRGERHD